jgi:hypothetical protein
MTSRSPDRTDCTLPVVKLIVEDDETGVSSYELAEQYDVRRHIVRDVLRRAGFDVSAKATRAALRPPRIERPR